MDSPSTNPLDINQVARFIAANNMKDIIAKLIFLQTKHALSESFIEEAKDIALASLTGAEMRRYSKFSILRPSMYILMGVFGINLLLKTLSSV